jgi:hypothetical protein
VSVPRIPSLHLFLIHRHVCSLFLDTSYVGSCLKNTSMSPFLLFIEPGATFESARAWAWDLRLMIGLAFWNVWTAVDLAWIEIEVKWSKPEREKEKRGR